MEFIARDHFVDENGNLISDRPVPFWWTREGQIVRYSLFGGFVLFMALFMGGGYLHAKHRLSKGKTPLAYHRWLLNRRQRAQYDPSFRDPMPYYQPYVNNDYTTQQQQYSMNNAPAPAYGSEMPPPTYQPPPGASKVDPSQWRAEPTRRSQQQDEEAAPDYASPPGPPPAALRR